MFEDMVRDAWLNLEMCMNDNKFILFKNKHKLKQLKYILKVWHKRGG